MISELQFWRAMAGYALARAQVQRAKQRQGRTQLGASALEWAIISAILVFQPDRAATQHHTRIRFIATLIGAAASVGAVALGLRGVPAFALALITTCSVCAATGLEEGLRPAGVATAVLLIRSDAPATEADELRFALDRILAVLGGGLVSLLIAQIPGLRLPPRTPSVD